MDKGIPKVSELSGEYPPLERGAFSDEQLWCDEVLGKSNVAAFVLLAEQEQQQLLLPPSLTSDSVSPAFPH